MTTPTTTPSALTVTLPSGLDPAEIATALEQHARALADDATAASLHLPADRGEARVPALNLALQLARAERLRLAAAAIRTAAETTP